MVVAVSSSLSLSPAMAAKDRDIKKHNMTFFGAGNTSIDCALPFLQVVFFPVSKKLCYYSSRCVGFTDVGCMSAIDSKLLTDRKDLAKLNDMNVKGAPHTTCVKR